MKSLATIEKIVNIKHHPNADKLDIVQVLGYECIVKRDQYSVGDNIIFIQPDSVLPDKEWAAFYKAKSSRVKAIKLRGEWSFGIVESIALLDFNALPKEVTNGNAEGFDVAEMLGITKYEPPLPQDLAAKGLLPFNIPKTDEERWQNLYKELPFGEEVIVTHKCDGQSWSAYVVLNEDGTVSRGVCGRTMDYKLDAVNKYTQNEKNYSVLDKLEAYCHKYNVSLCLRGEQYGIGIQAFAANPHSKLPLGLQFFSVYNISKKKYENIHDEHNVFKVCNEICLPTVEVLENKVILTQELINRYDHELEKISLAKFAEPVMFEGVVVKTANSSFKIINKHYDAAK